MGIKATGNPIPKNEPAVSWPFWARFVQLLGGLLLFGASLALLVRARLGLDSWDVLNQGLSLRTHRSIGTWVICTGALVLLLWVPLRQRPGIGTVANVMLVGIALNATLEVLPSPQEMALRVLYLLGGIVLNGVATGAYIGAGLGPGPRDGLMVGLARRGHSIRVVRTLIELTVVGTGFLLGGTVGIGTVLFAVSIGPLAHLTIPALSRAQTGDGPAIRGGQPGRSTGASSPRPGRPSPPSTHPASSCRGRAKEPT